MKTVGYEKGLYIVCWMVEKPKLVIQLTHGMVEHIERYDAFAQFLNQHQIAVVGHDHRGHGHTAEQNQDFGIFPEKPYQLVDDLAFVHQFIKDKIGEVPIVLLGHSMGSFISRCYFTKIQPAYHGLILMGTGQTNANTLKIVLFLTKIAKKYFGASYSGKFFNRLTLEQYAKYFSKNRKRADWLTRDVSYVECYMNDKYCQFVPSIGMYQEIFRFAHLACQNQSIEILAKSDLPILLISGDKDPVGNFSKGVSNLAYQLKEKGNNHVRVRLYREIGRAHV